MDYQKFLMEYELRRAELELKAQEVGANINLKDAQAFKTTREAIQGGING
jgi:hypothetical protein